MPSIRRSPRRHALVAPLLACLVLALAFAGSPLSPAPTTASAQATPIAGPTATPDPTAVALDAAVANLLTQQTADGGFLGFSGEPDAGTTTDAIVALRAAATQGLETEPAIDAAIGFLEQEGVAYAATGPGQAAKLALATVAAGRDPGAFAGIDLLAALTASAGATPTADGAAAPPTTGVYGNGVYDHALVLLALAAAGSPVDPAAIEALRATQGADGSWAFDGATTPGAGDTNTTALVIQALAATGNGADPIVEAALAYLRSAQTVTGQFAFQATTADGAPPVADANSTALAVQAILAVGQDPTSADDWRNAARGLAAFQNVGGAFRYQDTEPADNLLATLQAVPALAGTPLPVAVACGATATPVAAAPPCVDLLAPAA